MNEKINAEIAQTKQGHPPTRTEVTVQMMEPIKKSGGLLSVGLVS